MDRDGTQDGYDLELLDAISGAVDVPVIASGGAGEPHHLVDGFAAGADAVLAPRSSTTAATRSAEVKDALAAAGVPVRRNSETGGVCPDAVPPGHQYGAGGGGGRGRFFFFFFFFFFCWPRDGVRALYLGFSCRTGTPAAASASLTSEMVYRP